MTDRLKMRLGYHPIYTDGLHPEVRFPRHRYNEVAQEIKTRGGEKLIEFYKPEAVERTQLTTVHCENYIDRFLNGELSIKERRKIGLRPWTADIIPRTLILTGGTLAAADFALHHNSYAANMAGGTHHAYRAHGSGYCIVNDIAIAAQHAVQHHGISRVAIIDLDVHQGDGTASIFLDNPQILTLSVHGEKNFPFRKQQSNVDISLENETGDTGYLEAVSQILSAAEDFKPQFVIYQAGVDPLETDRLGKLSVTREGLIARNSRVFDFVDRHNLPCLVLMGGGYSDPIHPTVMALTDLFIEAAYRHHWRQTHPSKEGKAKQSRLI